MERTEVRFINKFFRTATRSEREAVKEELVISAEMEEIYRMFYLENKPVSFIADSLGYSEAKIYKDLKQLREILIKILQV